MPRRKISDASSYSRIRQIINEIHLGDVGHSCAMSALKHVSGKSDDEVYNAFNKYAGDLHKYRHDEAYHPLVVKSAARALGLKARRVPSRLHHSLTHNEYGDQTGWKPHTVEKVMKTFPNRRMIAVSGSGHWRGDYQVVGIKNNKVNSPGRYAQMYSEKQYYKLPVHHLYLVSDAHHKEEYTRDEVKQIINEINLKDISHNCAMRALQHVSGKSDDEVYDAFNKYKGPHHKYIHNTEYHPLVVKSAARALGLKATKLPEQMHSDPVYNSKDEPTGYLKHHSLGKVMKNHPNKRLIAVSGYSYPHVIGIKNNQTTMTSDINDYLPVHHLYHITNVHHKEEYTRDEVKRIIREYIWYDHPERKAIRKLGSYYRSGYDHEDRIKLAKSGAPCGVNNSCFPASMSHATGISHREVIKKFMKHQDMDSHDAGSNEEVAEKAARSLGHNFKEMHPTHHRRHQINIHTGETRIKYDTASEVAKKFPNHNFIAGTRMMDPNTGEIHHHVFNIKNGKVHDPSGVIDKIPGDPPVVKLFKISHHKDPRQLHIRGLRSGKKRQKFTKEEVKLILKEFISEISREYKKGDKNENV